jgi:hypothetical protein
MFSIRFVPPQVKLSYCQVLARPPVQNKMILTTFSPDWMTTLSFWLYPFLRPRSETVQPSKCMPLTAVLMEDFNTVQVACSGGNGSFQKVVLTVNV